MVKIRRGIAQYLLVVNLIGRVVPVMLHKNFGIVSCTYRDSVVLIQAFTILTKSPSSYHITTQRWHSTCLRGTPFICVHNINGSIFSQVYSLNFFNHSWLFMVAFLIIYGGMGFEIGVLNWVFRVGVFSWLGFGPVVWGHLGFRGLELFI